MYKIVYTKAAVKDIPKLKAAHLDIKAKTLIEIIKENEVISSVDIISTEDVEELSGFRKFLRIISFGLF